jgi:hypothetical protein
VSSQIYDHLCVWKTFTFLPQTLYFPVLLQWTYAMILQRLILETCQQQMFFSHQTVLNEKDWDTHIVYYWPGFYAQFLLFRLWGSCYLIIYRMNTPVICQLPRKYALYPSCLQTKLTWGWLSLLWTDTSQMVDLHTKAFGKYNDNNYN